MSDRNLARLVSQIRHLVGADGGLSDAQLLQRFTTIQDEAAFEVLVRRHERLVFGLCRRILLDYHDAEDAFQATFLALARKAGSIAKGQAVASWLYKVAYRIAVVVRARKAKEAARDRPLAAAQDAPAPPHEHLSTEWLELRSILDEEINRLPERFRAPIVLCYLEGKTIDDAALQLGCPRGTVASRLSRARERLRGSLTRRGLVISSASLVAGLGLTGKSTAAPYQLLDSAIRITTLCGIGKAAASSAVPGRVIALTEEVLKTMFIKKLTTAAAVLILSTGAILVGSALGMQLYGSTAVEPAPFSAGIDKPIKQPPSPAKTAQAKEPPAATKPTVSKPVQRDLPALIGSRGQLEPSRTVEVVAKVGGRLASVHCKPSDTVKKGDLLFELDSTVFREALAKADLKLAGADAERKRWEAEVARANKLMTKGVFDKQTYDEVEVQAEAAARARKLADLEFSRAKRELEATKVTAPADGTVGKILVNPGSGVTSDKSILTTVSSHDPMHVIFALDEGSFRIYQRQLQEKKTTGSDIPVYVRLEDDRGFAQKAKIAFFDDRFDPRRGEISVTAIVPNANRQLLPGMTVTVGLPMGNPDPTLLVPLEAINFGNPGAFVLLINDDNLVKLKPVKLRERYDKMVVVESLLGPGVADAQTKKTWLRADDWVVIDGAAGLRPGDQVEPRRVKMP